MDRIDRDAAPFGIAAIGLGIVGIVFGKFALQWQPLPPAVAGNATLAAIAGLVLVVGGALAMWRRTTAIGGAVLGIWFGLWVLAMHLPVLAMGVMPLVVALLGIAEILAMSMAGAQLVLAHRERPVVPWVRIAPRVLFGLSAIMFGISHFAYLDFTAKMIPGWLPAPTFWAMATGAGHIAAGVAIMTGVMSRLAAKAEAAMCASFVLLLHLPRVIAKPDSHAEWTMLFIAMLIAGAAWVIRLAPQRNENTLG